MIDSSDASGMNASGCCQCSARGAAPCKALTRRCALEAVVMRAQRGRNNVSPTCSCIAHENAPIPEIRVRTFDIDAALTSGFTGLMFNA